MDMDACNADEQQDCSSFVIDISRGGIGIGSPNETVSEGDRVSVEIETLFSRERWTLSGTVRHRKFDKSRRAWCFGVQFDRLISEDDAMRIAKGVPLVSYRAVAASIAA